MQMVLREGSASVSPAAKKDVSQRSIPRDGCSEVRVHGGENLNETVKRCGV